MKSPVLLVSMAALLFGGALGLSCTPQGTSTHPHLTSCSRYNMCVEGVLYPMECGPGLFFSRSEGWCTSPLEARCEVEQPVCPWEAPEGHLLANGMNCRTYFRCSNGSPVAMECPSGQVFDRTRQVCSQYAECVVSGNNERQFFD